MSSDSGYGDAETRQRILVSALSAIRDRGTSLSVKDVAERAGVSRQAVYLHFGDRTGLVIGVVQYMDEVLDLGSSVEAILASTDGADLLEKAMRVHAEFSVAIDDVALILEAAQYDDVALGTAWRDRLNFRHKLHLAFVQRLEELGELANGWSVEEAGDLFYAVTLVGPWRELTRELDWSSEQYVDRMSRFLARALLG